MILYEKFFLWEEKIYIIELYVSYNVVFIMCIFLMYIYIWVSLFCYIYVCRYIKFLFLWDGIIGGVVGGSRGVMEELKKERGYLFVDINIVWFKKKDSKNISIIIFRKI